eukprot:m.25842 g.25842  ORF g.25842 m.25842 type:complete len:174 (-) comp9932_c0_seq1:234-755(-)
MEDTALHSTTTTTTSASHHANGGSSSSTGKGGYRCSVIQDGKACKREAKGPALTPLQRQRFGRCGLAFRRKSQGTVHSCSYHLRYVDTTGKLQSTQQATPDAEEEDVPKVDFSVLGPNSLKRFRQFFKLPEVSKKEMIKLMDVHFTKQPVQELEVILGFLNYARKARLNNKKA